MECTGLRGPGKVSECAKGLFKPAALSPDCTGTFKGHWDL